VISIRGKMALVFITAALLEVVLFEGLYIRTASSPKSVTVLSEIPVIGNRTMNMTQVAEKELVLPFMGQYSVEMRGKAIFYVQTREKLYREPKTIHVDTSRAIRVILLNQSTDVGVTFRYNKRENYGMIASILLLAGVVALAVRMFRFE
jgi:hypothetical protein